MHIIDHINNKVDCEHIHDQGHISPYLYRCQVLHTE